MIVRGNASKDDVFGDAGRNAHVLNTKPRIQSAVRTIDVLQVVARASSSGVSARDLSAELKLPRQVIYHLIHTLLSVNMLRQVGGKNYVLGLSTANLARGYRRQTSAPEYLARYAERAAGETGETAYVASNGLGNGAQFPKRWIALPPLQIGNVAALNGSALGQLLLGPALRGSQRFNAF